MKVIDLLNKIANGEEVPKKIKYKDYIYIQLDNYCYFCKETNDILSQDIYAELSRLNEEIEIIEDTPKENKKIEKLNINTYDEILDTTLASKINEIIDRLNGDDNE